MVTTMRSDWTSGGLIPALRTLAADTRTRGALEVRVSVPEEPDLPSSVKEALAMISREALNNVVRHADASRVDIVLSVDTHEVVMLIADDGRGFDPGLSPRGHFGLLSMRERAQNAGATLELHSEEGVGTEVRARLPRGGQRGVCARGSGKQ
jgi:signal transduction histidine kinase